MKLAIHIATDFILIGLQAGLAVLLYRFADLDFAYMYYGTIVLLCLAIFRCIYWGVILIRAAFRKNLLFCIGVSLYIALFATAYYGVLLVGMAAVIGVAGH
jgi:hypothetical protein